MKGFFIFLKNQIKLSIRDMNMPIFAIIMPLVIMAVLGIIYGEKTAFDGAGYTFMEQSFGALCAISICAGGLMGLPMALADLRERKVLKRLWVTPASPALLLGVELALYVFYCAASLVTLWVAAFIWKVKIRGSALTFFGSWLITMFSTLSVGMFVGGIAKNSKQASVIASVLYFPMLVFSGVTLPMEVMPEFLRKIVGAFPLAQGITLMKSAFLGTAAENIFLPIAVMTGITIIFSVLSVRFFRWE